MTTAVVATLPTGSDPNHWSDEEKALVSAAGLVHTDNSGVQTPAPRPVVAAFLQHCSRTGLDPFARQIYAIARKNRGNLAWTVQISIDGARLIAERTGEYEGQTTPEFTADGTTWTEVWLDEDQQPKAARVGVFRRGFREPLYAVALWKAYAVYQDVWEGGRKVEGEQKLSAMWAKMGPLMLAKCAEMLALRKAFPQDLSGLYSTEEMDQAGAPREVVKQAERATVVSAGAIATPVTTRDWRAELEAVETLEGCAALYREADAAGELGIVVGLAGDNDDGSAHTVMDLFWARKRELERVEEATTPALVDVPVTKTGRRQWVREARALTERGAVHSLMLEATAAGAPVQVIEELGAIERTLPGPEPEVGGWATAEVPGDGDWVESSPGVFVEADVEPAGVLDESIGES